MSTTQFSVKYRPKSLSSYICYDNVRRTLQGMIAKNKYPHTLLLTGGTGNGKTSLARLLSREINKVPKGEECPDIIEINIGDERGIESARNLAQSVKFKPMQYEYKIVILDEIHMATQQMASALLKVIEEPPEHCIFILCTDQPDKLLKTIYGRCTVINLEQLTPDMLVPNLRKVCKKEGLKIDDETLLKIAEAANGQPRVSLQLLQQVSYSWDGTSKGLKLAVQDILKTTDSTSVLRFIAGLYKSNYKVVMEVITNTTDYSSLINKALELHRFVFDNMLKGQGLQVNKYYWSPDRNKLWEKITKDCKNWQQKAPHVHALLTDLRKEMYTYSINEYHLYMSKVLLWMEENEEE